MIARRAIRLGSNCIFYLALDFLNEIFGKGLFNLTQFSKQCCRLDLCMSGDKDIYLSGDCRVDGTRIPPLSTLCWVSLSRAADGAVLMSSYKKKPPPEVHASAESGAFLLSF